MTRWIRVLGLNVLIGIVLLALAEGVSSLTIVGWRLVRPASQDQILAESLHTQYDAELGWVSVPDLEVHDLYGRGKHLRTNSRGFRGDEDIAAEEPVGQARLLCSGDSFTLGYGVADENAWCALLEEQDARLQTVNMGQGGYGVGQAFLWFRRAAADLDHSIHLFAFITSDFRRMAGSDFAGYEKPVLTVSSEGLAVGNTPVPVSENSWLAGPRREGLRELIRSLRVVEFGRLALGKLGFGTEARQASSGEARLRESAARVLPVLLDSLVAMNQRKGSLLVLVHLPVEPELRGLESDADLAFWQERLGAESTARGIAYVDLVSDMRELPAYRTSAMFIPSAIGGLRSSAGHYTEEGNAWVADRIYDRLSGLPEFTAKLESLRGPGEPGSRSGR